MIFTRAFNFALLAALPLLAIAATTPTTPASQCNVDNLQCCNSTQESSSPSPALISLLGLLGVVVGNLTGQVGLSCSQVTLAGLAGNSCSAQPVCCSNNSFNGLVSLGCTPINISL